MKTGAGEGTRTPNRLITNEMLYQLSYASSRRSVERPASAGWLAARSVRAGVGCVNGAGGACQADPRGARRVRAKRGEERVHLDLPLGPVADGRVEHAGEREVEPA